MKHHKKQEFERELGSHSPAALVTPRDPESWSNPTYHDDKQFKKERSEGTSQHGVNYIMSTYLHYNPNMRLTVGRQRL